MQHYPHYQMHTGAPVAGWLTIIFGIAALIVGYCAFFKGRNKYDNLD